MTLQELQDNFADLNEKIKLAIEQTIAGFANGGDVAKICIDITRVDLEYKLPQALQNEAQKRTEAELAGKTVEAQRQKQALDVFEVV